MELFEELEQEGIDRGLLEAIRAFRAEHPVPQEAQGRLIRPKLLYYGREVWQAAATALLCGENLLLSGPKATGKNVLAENLAAAFGRPVWNMSMYVNIDAASLIGADTLKEGEVVFREGPVCQCARLGGFGVLDEVNMAKNEALAVLHAALDFRRVLDVPGYRPVPLDDAARFIGTMNYGYAGTTPLRPWPGSPRPRTGMRRRVCGGAGGHGLWTSPTGRVPVRRLCWTNWNFLKPGAGIRCARGWCACLECPSWPRRSAASSRAA